MKATRLIVTGLIMIYAGFGCDSGGGPTGSIATPDSEFADLQARSFPQVDQTVPAPLVTVSVGADELEFWPYTGTDFSGTPHDPINLILYGQTDPRDIRTALMALDGNRDIPGLPPVPPFNSTWTDAIGDMQTGFGAPDEWTGNVVQLACGDYEEARFHLRLFQIGDWTVANAHFEVLIPGTADHQVLSWELAEQFVLADFMRTGLLDPIAPVIPAGQINDAPFRTIPAVIYNGLPVELRMLIGGPLEDVIEDVPIATDGHAMILNLAQRMEPTPGTIQAEFTINYGQVIPKPFCSSGPGDYVWVEGPVHLEQTVSQLASGVFTMGFKARGELTVTPVNPLTGEAIGESMTAFVRQAHSSLMNDSHFKVSGILYQRLGQPTDEAGGLLFTRLRVTSDGNNGYEAIVRCNAADWSPPVVAGAAGLLNRGVDRSLER